MKRGRFLFGCRAVMFACSLTLASGCGSQMNQPPKDVESEPAVYEKEVIKNERLENYLFEELIGMYGLAAEGTEEDLLKYDELTYETDWKQTAGIAAATLTDLDGNEADDLAVLRFETDEEALTCVIDVYTEHGEEIVPFTGEGIEKKILLPEEEQWDEEITTVFYVRLQEDHSIKLSWKYAEGKGVAPGQAVIRGGEEQYRFENEEIIAVGKKDWIS